MVILENVYIHYNHYTGSIIQTKQVVVMYLEVYTHIHVAQILIGLNNK